MRPHVPPRARGRAAPRGRPRRRSRWTLAWSDEFDGPAGARVDPARWTFDVGGDGWGNNELEYYTDRAENAPLSGDGHLVIHALRERYRARTARARVHLGPPQDPGPVRAAYGRFEARIKLPRGQGLWPAFWMLGADIDARRLAAPAARSTSWRTSEGARHRPRHDPWPRLLGRRVAIGGAFTLPGGASRGRRLPRVRGRVGAGVIRFYVDDTLYQTRTPADLPAGSRWVFDHPFFLLLNVAVGGNWPGNPDATHRLPADDAGGLRPRVQPGTLASAHFGPTAAVVHHEPVPGRHGHCSQRFLAHPSRCPRRRSRSGTAGTPRRCRPRRAGGCPEPAGASRG